MKRQHWRTDVGLGAVLGWSFFVGLPVLSYHMSSWTMTLGEHIHAAILFVASQGLVFWLVARPTNARPASAHSASARPAPAVAEVPRPGRVATATVSQVWEAELISARPSDSAAGYVPAASESSTIQVTVANYLGSSQARLVFLEPGGKRYTLLAGQEIRVAASGQRSPPSLRVIESDLATQVCFTGADQLSVAVQAISNHQEIDAALSSGSEDKSF